jgi:hypothetical protein
MLPIKRFGKQCSCYHQHKILGEFLSPYMNLTIGGEWEKKACLKETEEQGAIE